MKSTILLLITMISGLGLFSFKNDATAAKTSLVSYYSDKFNGKKTASGELFDNTKLTAANRTLPFGTKLKLTNIKNGKSVIVKINDRGPFHSSRVLDVSKAAFAAIESTNSGSAAVEYEEVE